MPTKFYTIGGHTISYGGFVLVGDAGALTITKTVTGSGFDPTRTFELTATFSNPVTYGGTTSAVHTFNLASGQSVTIANIPDGTSYSVEEAPLSPIDIAAGYSFEGITNGSGTITGRHVYAVATNGYTSLPAKTIRLLYPDGVSPIYHSKGTRTQVSSSPNVWEYHYDGTDWSNFLVGDDEVLQVLGVGNTGDVVDMGGMFEACSSLTAVALFDTSSCTYMTGMFSGCRSLTTVPLLDTRACTFMNNMFDGCSSLTSVPLFDTSACTNMLGMFNGCSSLTSVPLFDTSACVEMLGMFSGCRNLSSVPLFDTSACDNMASMFRDCYTLTTVPLLDTSSCENMSSMFSGCTGLALVPLFDTGACKFMSEMFSGCISLASVPLFDTSACKDMSKMFDYCQSLTAVPLFDTGVCEDMSKMFRDCPNVGGGALALYRQASAQAVPPVSHAETFKNCGIDTTTGAAELAQIPSGWK